MAKRLSRKARNHRKMAIRKRRHLIGRLQRELREAVRRQTEEWQHDIDGHCNNCQ